MSAVLSSMLNVKQKQIAPPVEPPRDRIWQRYVAENISDVNNEFNQLFFRCSVPSSNSLIKSFDLVFA